MTMRRAAIALALAVFCAGCGGGGRGAPGEDASRHATPVEVFLVSRGPVTATVASSGTVEARHDVPIHSEAAGRVVEVPARVGDSVEAGDVLVRLDDEVAANAARQAEAQLALAELELDDAHLNLGRAKELWETGDFSDVEYEAAERRFKSARASHMAAEAAAGSARRQLRDTAIESPVGGRVAMIHAKVGHLIVPGTPVAHVVDDSVVQVDIGLSEDRVADVRAGQPAEVSVRSAGDRVFTGRVDYVGRRADDATKTFPVRVIVENPRGALRSGMVAEVRIAALRLGDVVVIERDWVIDRYGEPAVFVAADSLAAVRNVRLGHVIGDQVVVESGLEPGDLVVSFGYEQLSENAPIEVRNVPSPAEDADANR